MKKRTIFSITTGLVSMMLAVPISLALTFNDVQTSSPYYNAVDGLSERGIMRGDETTGNFRPDDLVTKAEAFRIILRGLSESIADNTSLPFLQTPSTETSAGNSTRGITRGELADFVYRLINIQDNAVTTPVTTPATTTTTTPATTTPATTTTTTPETTTTTPTTPETTNTDTTDETTTDTTDTTDESTDESDTSTSDNGTDNEATELTEDETTETDMNDDENAEMTDDIYDSNSDWHSLPFLRSSNR